MSTFRESAAKLVQNVAGLQRWRIERTTTKDHTNAIAAAHLIQEQLDDAGPALVREALLVATGVTTDVPAVLDQQDVAAIVGRDELMSLVRMYAAACVDWCSSADRDSAARACETTYNEVERAAQALCAAVAPVELRGAAEGRTS